MTTLKSIPWCLSVLILLSAGATARADGGSGLTAATGQRSLATKVGDGQNQTLGGSCNSGHCRISGGTARGGNLFHRLSKLRTNSNINKISLDNNNQGSAFDAVVLSNIDSNGTFINTPFELDLAKSDLIILSPGGIEIGGLASFTNVNSLGLSTAEKLSIGSETFHYDTSTPADLDRMTAAIALAQSAFSHDHSQGSQISIAVDDILSIDGDLLLHGVGGIDIDTASSASNGSLEIGGDLDIASSGQSQLNNGTTSTSSTWIGPVTITANAVSIDAGGNDAQPQALMLSGSSITTDNAIVMTGVSANEAVGLNHDDLRGIVITDAELISSNGDIVLTGIAGTGNGELNGLDLDISKGSGVVINNSLIDTTTGTIDLEGDGSLGLVLDGSHGVEILWSELNANNLVASGTGGTGFSEGGIDRSNGIAVSDSDISAEQGVRLTGIAGNSTPDGAELGMVMGVSVETSTLTASAGQVKLTGTGGSGSALEISSGVYLDGSDLRAASLSITGDGGTTSDLDNASISVGVAITDSNTLDTNSSNDDLGVITLSDQVAEQSGDVVIDGDGGSGLDDSGGVWSEADIDSGASIQISGRGGKGSTDIYGVALEGMPTLEAETSIVIDGEGGDGSTVLDSNGVYLSEVELIAKSGIRIDGVAGTSDGPTSLNGQLDGVYIADSTLTVSGREALSDLDNPNQANLIITGQPGSAQLHIEESSGIIIDESSISSSGTIWMQGDGRTTESDILEYGNGIYITDTTLDSESLYLEGYAASARQPDFTDEAGDLIPQKSLGVEIIASTITASSTNAEADRSIDIKGLGGGGNVDINGIDLYTSILISDDEIRLDGDGGSSDAEVTDGIGVSLIETDLTTDIIDIQGDGSTGSSTTGSSGLWIDDVTMIGTNRVTITGKAGLTTSVDGVSTANDGISLVGGSLIQSDGPIQLDGDGGESNGGSNSSYGVWIYGASIDSKAAITVNGQGGKGREVGNANGVSISSDVDESTDTLIHLAEIKAEDNLTLDGTGGSATVSATETRGVVLDSVLVEAGGRITIDGTGGTSNQDSNTSDSNQGVYIIDAILDGTGDINVIGQGGDGGALVAGIEFFDTSITTPADIELIGTGGEGDVVTMAEGVWADGLVLETTDGAITITGTGGQGNKITAGYGVEFYNSSVTLSDSQSLSIRGEGATATNQIDSIDNAGLSLIDSTITGGQSLDLVGLGGEGGENNTGIELFDTTITASKGSVSLKGTGGEGTNIKQAIGVRLEGFDAFRGQIKADSITITGDGGTSNLRRDAFDESGEDTFQQTANNVGVVIDQFDLEATTGELSVTGTGGVLVLHETANNDDTSAGELSTAFNIEGLNINNATTLSSQATLLKGSAGQPISGHKNSGTTITNSTITTAIDPAGQARNASSTAIDNRIEGNAFSGTNDNYGLSINNTEIESKNQDLTLAGQGGLKATGEKNFGIYIGNQSSVEVGDGNGSNNLNIYGAGGDGTDMTGGILTENTDYTVDGTIKMVGVSEGAGQFGNNSVEIFNDVTISSGGDTDISGSNNVNISDTDIDSGGDTDITAGEDLNIADTEITTEGDTSITAGDDVNISDSSIDSGGSTDISAEEDVNITGSDISSEGDTTIAAGDDVEITNTELNAGNSINLTAGNQLSLRSTDVISTSINLSSANNQINLTTSAVNEPSPAATQDDSSPINTLTSPEAGAPGLSLLQTTTSEGSDSDALTLSLSGNVNYFPEEETETGDDTAGDDSNPDRADEAGVQPSSEDNTAREIGTTTTLSAKQTKERHNETEAEASQFVSNQLGLKPQPPMTIPAIQQLLGNGQRIMNGAGR